MTQLKLNKDQIQKMALSTIGFIAMLYVYFNFFLAPLTKSRAAMEKTIADLQTKIAASTSEIPKAANLEKQATAATTRYASLQALSPEGAPIAWFPPRIKIFLANQQIDKVTAKLESTTAYPQPELATWVRHAWAIELPQTDFATLGKAVAELENAEPLLSISHLIVRGGTDDPQFQQVSLIASTAILKR